jgi:hypothetical protein
MANITVSNPRPSPRPQPPVLRKYQDSDAGGERDCEPAEVDSDDDDE